ncbi:MAG: MFS transporter [Paracoccaceae bacterium]
MLPIRVQAGWGLADMGVVVFVVVKQLLVLAFLVEVLGVPPALAGAVTTGVLLFDVVTDPVVGWLSDRVETRWGRRAPWMAVGALVMTGGTWALFLADPAWGTAAKVAWVGGFFVLATIGFTMVAVPYGASAGEITQDPAERSRLTAWRMGFASVGILIGGAAIPALTGARGDAGAVAAVAPLMIGAIWLSVWLTRRAPRVTTGVRLSPLQALRTVASNAAFLRLVALYGLMTLAVALVTAGLPFAALSLIEDTAGGPLAPVAASLGTLSALFACFVLGSILSQAPWVLACARLGKVGALLLGLALYVGLLVALYAALPSRDVTAMGALFVLAGVTNGAYQQIPWAIYPDLMDVTRARTGQALEGAFSALWLFGQKVANALAPLLLGLILSAAGWREGAVAVQDEDARDALRAAMTLLPAAILALSAAGLWLLYRPAQARLMAA